MGIAFTPFLARIIRGEALQVSRRCSMSRRRAPPGTSRPAMMIIRHILPNIIPHVIVQAHDQPSPSPSSPKPASPFSGLGTQPPNSSWGLMIQASRDYLDVAPWTALAPGGAVALTVLALNMSGDVLRDVTRSEGHRG